MPKKITPAQRKVILRLHGEGKTYAQIRYAVGIGDERTLKKHLAIAKEEAQQGQATIEIIKEAQTKHLDEVRELIERWKKRIAVPPLGLDEVWLAWDCQEISKIEHNPLFEGIKEHLPLKPLWEDYDTWKQKRKEYINIGWNLEQRNNQTSNMERKRKGNCTQDEPKNILKPLTREIQDLQEKIHKQLDEILLRQDYIIYKCKFCPGQLKRPR